MMNSEQMDPQQRMWIPQRPFGSGQVNARLPSTSVSIIGLGGSSFSTFFWTSQDWENIAQDQWTVQSLDRSHPRVREWIRTIQYAVQEAGIMLLDTAPWYGHGTSEVVIGWAMQELRWTDTAIREKIIINTKVGRYEADPYRQFDFSAAATLRSVERSLDRLHCDGYVDVLQLHDPEFAPSLEILLNETIPSMLICQKKGWCRALGMTGYPLEVQHHIFQKSYEKYNKNIWDQSLTYGHFNLHDTSLIANPIAEHTSFAEFCKNESILLLVAAPLSMGMLTDDGPPHWHPASNDLKEACARAAKICEELSVNISTLALLFAMSEPNIPCTILGMGSVEEVKRNHAVALRLSGMQILHDSEDILDIVLTASEKKALQLLKDPVNGPFAQVWKNGRYQWDGVAEVQQFWKQVKGSDCVEWQQRASL